MPGGMARDRRSEARQDRSFSPVAFFFGARIPGKIAPASTEGDTPNKNAARSHKPDGATSFPTSCEAHKSYHPEIPHHNISALKSTAPRAPSSRSSIPIKSAAQSPTGGQATPPRSRNAHRAGEFLVPSIAGALADKAALKKSRRSGTKVPFNGEVTRQRIAVAKP